MKKIMTAALGLSLLSGTAMFAAQDAGKMDDSSKSTDTSKKKSKKSKKSKKMDSTTDSTTAPKQ